MTIEQIMETNNVTRLVALMKTANMHAIGGRFDTQEVQRQFAPPAPMRTEQDDTDEYNQYLRDLGW